MLRRRCLLFGACRADGTPPADATEPTAVAPSVEAAPFVAEPASTPAAPTVAPGPTPDPTLAKTQPGAEPAIAAGEVDPEPPTPAEPTRPRKVLILGDSLAATGFGALLEKKLDAHPDVECFRKGKSASGLARPDFFDWPGEAKRQIQRGRQQRTRDRCVPANDEPVRQHNDQRDEHNHAFPPHEQAEHQQAHRRQNGDVPPGNGDDVKGARRL